MPIRARKDIICYKELAIWINTFEDAINSIPFQIVTPYMITNVAKNGIMKAGKKMQFYAVEDGLYSIANGAIHAYTSLDKALFYNIKTSYSLITKCVIKKGTLYCKSYIGDCIAAERMEIVEITIPPTNPNAKKFVDNYFTNLKSI